jgi:hypothetical protein
MFDSDMVASLAFYLNHRPLDARLQLAWTKRRAQEDLGVMRGSRSTRWSSTTKSVPAGRAAAHASGLNDPFLTGADVARVLELNQQTVRNGTNDQ